jgi:pilus assembly protein CpaC
VIVTPYIVNPVHESDLATPIDGFNPPTDVQQIFFGRLNKIYGPPGKHPNGVYHGQVGYIIE